MTKQLMTACPLAVSLILVCGFALADPGQEQACAGRVAEMRNIPMSDIRATKIGVWGSMEQKTGVSR